MLTQYRFWIAVSFLLAIDDALHWCTIDNHQYLIFYWALAIGLSLRHEYRLATLKTNARLLVGLTFFFAFLSKATSGEFVRGHVMRFVLLTDQRFEVLARTGRGITISALADNRHKLSELLADFPLEHDLVLSGAGIAMTSSALTAWTLVIEFCIAAAFLRTSTTDGIRHWLLLLFVITAYPVAPVIGFGWVLLILGFTHTSDRQNTIRRTYQVAYLLVPFLPTIIRSLAANLI